MFGAFFFFFSKTKRNNVVSHIFKKKIHFYSHVSIGLEYRFRGLDFRWLYRTKVRLPFALHLPVLGQSVDSTSGAAMLAPVGLVGSGTGLHSPKSQSVSGVFASNKFYTFYRMIFLFIYVWTGPAKGLGKLGLGLRPHQKTKNFLGKKAPLSIVKGLNFYKIIYIYFLKVVHFFY